ncbi:hypothetical protein FGO68_gene17143 [Halteria grandinella]|uniref:Uncharacterized protein n=1 Tax=Halteria grandinella TaxID=5974 RepID=A0A8J8NB97_HALGN|nr:hypothetical protein FGO68_gene17143 [Halteria grandinella]
MSIDFMSSFAKSIISSSLLEKLPAYCQASQRSLNGISQLSQNVLSAPTVIELWFIFSIRLKVNPDLVISTWVLPILISLMFSMYFPTTYVPSLQGGIESPSTGNALYFPLWRKGRDIVCKFSIYSGSAQPDKYPIDALQGIISILFSPTESVFIGSKILLSGRFNISCSLYFLKSTVSNKSVLIWQYLEIANKTSNGGEAFAVSYFAQDTLVKTSLSAICCCEISGICCSLKYLMLSAKIESVDIL